MSQTKAQLIDNLVSPITGALGSAAAPTFSFTADLNTGLYSPGADQLAFATGGTGRLFIDSSGRLLVGTSTARSNFFGTTLSSLTQTEGIGGSTARGSLSVINNDVSNNPPYVLLGRSGAATLGSNAAVVSGSRLGTLTFHGADGASFIEAATVAGEVDGTPGSNDMPGRLVFSTTSDNAGSPTERMRLDSSGRLGLGTSGPTANFQVNHTSTAPSLSSFTGSAATFNGTSTIRLSIGTNPAPNYTSWIQSADASGNAYPLLLNPSGGNVGIGSTPVVPLDVRGADNVVIGATPSSGNGEGSIFLSCIGTGTKGNIIARETLSFQITSSSTPVTSGTERARIDSSGRLLVGTSTSVNDNIDGSGYANRVQIEGSSIGDGLVVRNTGAASRINIVRLGSFATNTEVGSLSFGAHPGPSIERARISAFTETTGGTGGYGGRLVFFTTADGASSPTERFRISNDGSFSSVIPGGSTLYPQFGCRAWVNFNGTGTVAIRASGNVSSITDNGTGDYTVNFTTAMVDANCTPVITTHRGDGAGANPGYNSIYATAANAYTSITSSSVRVSTTNSATVSLDMPYVGVAIFR